jgi:predicted nucleic acid-binding protein
MEQLLPDLRVALDTSVLVNAIISDGKPKKEVTAFVL